VSAGTVVSKGKITGDIIAKEKVRLLAPAVLNGSVKAPMLSMEEGVLFNGNIEMSRAEVHDLQREAGLRAVNAPAPNIKRVTG
ncbi:MAG: polymer-forming cytoskeletal protein, partial [Nitrospirota bacterium]|nr:polymer-forming cytoskeletal protein [Nitrospirota bacterium]